MGWRAWLTGLGVSLLAGYAVVLVLLARHARAHPGTVGLRDALRALPELARFLWRLSRDRSLPRRVRVAVVLLIGYLASPVDLVPDAVPVLGYADDVVVAAVVLRWVVHRAGPAALDRQWRGGPAGLAVLRRVAGLPAEPSDAVPAVPAVHPVRGVPGGGPPSEGEERTCR